MTEQRLEAGKMRIPLFALAFALIPAIPAAAVEAPSAFKQKGSWQIHGDGPHYLGFGLGVFDVDEEPVGAARVEFRFGEKFFFIGPALGFLANTDGSYFGYAGIYADISYKNLVITPMAGAADTKKGKGSTWAAFSSSGRHSPCPTSSTISPGWEFSTVIFQMEAHTRAIRVNRTSSSRLRFRWNEIGLARPQETTGMSSCMAFVVNAIGVKRAVIVPAGIERNIV